MPYIKQREPPFIRVARLLKGYGLDATALSAVIGCSYNTAQQRLKNPKNLTLEELETVSRKAHIPWDEVKEAMVK